MFIHSLIQQMIMECLLCLCCPGGWGQHDPFAPCFHSDGFASGLSMSTKYLWPLPWEKASSSHLKWFTWWETQWVFHLRWEWQEGRRPPKVLRATQQLEIRCLRTSFIMQKKKSTLNSVWLLEASEKEPGLYSRFKSILHSLVWTDDSRNMGKKRPSLCHRLKYAIHLRSQAFICCWFKDSD